ncbi:protein FAR1-RELATED SEQUENCE 5-like [Rosa rugosa]|uniref:protein FAR1-RELATED SEQUENCE 5-like n=1 Tax=Rosa rugosa TaxID=74645 RepID=UPI002B413AA3|nr:protein FAR1-RELATED SEQUENCE 5-like [Rosa rugosa]
MDHFPDKQQLLRLLTFLSLLLLIHCGRLNLDPSDLQALITVQTHLGMTNGSGGNEMQYKGVRYDKLCTEDLKGQEFKTVEEAESFYNAYAKAMGFDIRNDYKRLSTRRTGRVTSLLLDLYNKLDSKRQEILLDGDAEAVLAYMRGKVATDSQFYCKFSIDENNRLANMFWRDSKSLVDYTCFGDILVFDSTYKTNPYEKSLVLFVGLNNHLSTTVFYFSLLMDETIETYIWILEIFISSMNNKRHIAVLTDGDKAMRRAIEVVLPGCPYRLCTWHIAKNVRRHLRKNSVFYEFKRCMWDEITPDGFEKWWNAMVNTHGLHNKDWVKMMYEKMQIWAEAFISGHFFARMRSTQRCKGMNSYMKGYLKSGVKLFELILALDRALLRLRNKVLEEAFRSNNSSHVLTSSLQKLEHHAGTIFTDSVFEHVRNEIDGVDDFITS